MRKLRSLLFMPGNNPAMLVGADNLGADGLIFDLEDAVSINEKDAARDLVCNTLSTFSYKFVAVRINPVDSPYWQNDLTAICQKLPDAIVIPKASVRSIQIVEKTLSELLGDTAKQQMPAFLLLLENAVGIIEAAQIAQSSPYNQALLLGGEDYSTDMSIVRTKTAKELEFARFQLANVARAYNLQAFDTPFTDVEDSEGLAHDARFARSIGFTGKLAINPRQLQIISDAFSPSLNELQQARALVAAAEEASEKGLGVFSFQGKMVDLPVVRRAQQLLEVGYEYGLIDGD